MKFDLARLRHTRAWLKPAHVRRHLKISSEFRHFEVENDSSHISRGSSQGAHKASG